ncbi:hypothetical protein FisN_19Lh285 [Fistulifera solaris]|uniref:LITAF domain-containing protein n=1 Tax=Fistulifera solaris TaxID=1519565 RepID=A0A1Z5K7H5_FISSO|nr:hypothetical protein FisN_19Lh285 [Fistulifera solaris]|eukprot:GAX22220.1 hypothetical protein FisN_19Lh285 [Fistulifera solaris]
MTVKDEPTDKKTDVEEPDIPFAEALSVPPQNNPVVQAAPLAPTAPTQSTTSTAVPTGAAPSGGTTYHLPNLGRQPKSLKCPSCQQDMQTDVTNQVDAFTLCFASSSSSCSGLSSGCPLFFLLAKQQFTSVPSAASNWERPLLAVAKYLVVECVERASNIVVYKSLYYSN